MYRTTRRNFLVSGAALGVTHWLRAAEARAQGAGAPKRFLVMHHPVGTVRANWTCSGSGADFQLSRILAPFEPVKSHMVVLDGIDIVCNGVGGGHEQGTVALMTGERTVELYPGNGGDDPKAAGPSVDQLILRGSPELQGTPIESLQVSCDDRVDVGEISTRRLSYSGVEAPMDPYLSPLRAYERVFGTLVPGGVQGLEALRRARRRRQSVLDFSLRDLSRMRTLAPSSEWERLDAHEAAVRALEIELQREADEECQTGEAPGAEQGYTDGTADSVDRRDDLMHERIGQNHFAVIRTAFQCDLTRVATFQWSPGTNHVSFLGMYPGEPNSIKMHHPVSHQFNDPNQPEFLTRVDTWYSQRTSALLQTLLETLDVDGTPMLDNTLVPYVTEVATADHRWYDAPFVVFGGPGVRLRAGRLERYSPRRPVNDMWLACARALGASNLTRLGNDEMYTGALDILI